MSSRTVGKESTFVNNFAEWDERESPPEKKKGEKSDVKKSESSDSKPSGSFFSRKMQEITGRKASQQDLSKSPSPPSSNSSISYDNLDDVKIDLNIRRSVTDLMRKSVVVERNAAYRWRTFDRIGAGSAAAPENIGNYIILEPSVSFCESLYEYFGGANKVKIINKSLDQVDMTAIPFEAYILVGNSFGFRENAKSWIDVEKTLGPAVIQKIRNYIKSEYLGEAPLYSSFIIETDHPVVKYLVYTVTYISISNDATSSSYHSLWSSLLAIRNHNLRKPDSKINRFASKGFSSMTLGDEECSRQMHLALHNFQAPPSEMGDSYLTAKSAVIEKNDKITPDERTSFILDMLISSDLENRDFISMSTADLVIQLFMTERQKDDPIEDYNMIHKAAARCICKYTFPEEYVPGVMRHIVSRGALPLLLSMVENREITPHPEINMSEVQYDPANSLIATGASGKVYKGVWRERTVAIKEYSENMLTFNEVEFRREAAILSMLKHDNVVSFYGASTNLNKTLYILTKFVEGGPLNRYIQVNDVPLATATKIALDISNGMAFLHSAGIIHRDLKSLNIMMGSNGVAQIIDFGSSRAVDNSKLMTSAMGTVAWMAPECLTDKKYTQKADVYSFGIILWELISRKEPFHDVNSFTIPIIVSKGKRPNIPDDCNPEFKKLIKQCWDQKPEKRPEFKDICIELQRLKDPPKLAEPDEKRATLRKKF